MIFTKAKPRTRRVIKAKSRDARETLKRLDSFINANDKRLVSFLVTLWKNQQAAITYKELREAILQGYMTEEQFTTWQSDYAVFLNTYMKDVLLKATTAGSKSIAEALLAGNDIYMPMTTGIENWVAVHGAEWITNMSDETREAVSTLIQYSAKGNLTVDELARVIRPTIGLTTKQSTANAKYYETVKAKMMEDNPKMRESTAEKKARDAAARYAARQHRERAQAISETELAFAYNKGADDAIQHAQNDGLLPKMKAVWSTAADEGVCDICSALDGEVVDYGDNFQFPGRSLYSGQKRTPPAHPRCRCAICYEEAD